MFQLPKALNAWHSPDFRDILKAELQQLEPGNLPLQQALAIGNYALETKFTPMILNADEDANFIYAKVGIFFSSIISGCSCADDPTPIDENNEYCEIQLDINKSTAEATVTLLPS